MQPPELQPGLDAIRDTGVPGVIAEAVIDGRSVTARSGVADIKTRAPMPEGAHFHIASNTKIFTATLVLQLVGEGRLSLDDTVEKWLPGLVTGNGNDGRRIKVRNLLQQTSGLVDYTGDLPIRSVEDWEREHDRTYRPEELVAMAMTHKPQWLPDPDERRFSYSNVNFIIAGMIVAKVTGRTYEEEVRDRIVRPLKLTGTIAPGTSPDIPDPHARSYAQFALDGPFIDTTAFNPSVVGAAGAIISTTADMNRLLQALVTGKLLPPAQLAEMQKVIDAAELHDRYPGARYGLGLISRPLSCGGVYWSHVGEGAAGDTRNGVTADGRRSIVVYMSAELVAPEARKRQEEAAAGLIDRTLCTK